MPSDVLLRRCELFDTMLRLLPTGKLVDLGTGHGAFAQRAARQGWDVTGVDARADRVPDDAAVSWVIADVREVDLEQFDVIACLGLFYHLTIEDQIDLVKRASGRPLILDTHVDNGSSTHRLSPRVTVGDHEGRWYREPGKTTSSWGNKQSFWHTPTSLHALLGRGGYPVVLEANPYVVPDRTFFLALSGAQAPK